MFKRIFQTVHYRAGAAGTAGTVLAVPLLVALLLVGMGCTVGGEWHPRGGAQLM